MKSGYNILWTEHALNELNNTIKYLEGNFTKKELKRLAVEIEETLALASQNPYLFQLVDAKMGIRRVVILTFNSMYFRVINSQIEILSFFSNRQNPKKLKF